MDIGRVIFFVILVAAIARGQVAPTADKSPPPASSAPNSGRPPSPWPYLETLSILKDASPAASLAALEHLRASRQRALDDSVFGAMYFDVLATVCSLVGDHRGALEAEREYFARAEPRIKGAADLGGYHAVPAEEAIVDAAKERRVVMLNEEHRLSLQRAFLADLLPAMRRQGFTHLAMEALSEDPGELQKRGYATAETGLYTRDTQFAEAIRLAIALGMKVVKYEPDPKEVGPEPGNRDRRSALALAELLRNDPGARIVVYAGRYHIAKHGDKTWTPLAARLREFTGIDPLCIDLIALRECERPDDEHPAFRAALDSGLVADRPVAFRNAAGASFSHWPEQIDFSVCFPRTIIRDGRPDWLARDSRRAVSIADRIPPVGETLLARADRSGEAPDAVAADQVILQPGTAVPALMLPVGRFRVRILTRDSRVLGEFEVDVAK